MPSYDEQILMRTKFMEAALGQRGDRYRFGAHAGADDADPKEFDSSELVEWAAHRAGIQDMPDGAWEQYRYLLGHEGSMKMSVENALNIRGALVFGFSDDPATSTSRPARSYVAISVGDGKNVIDVSERAGEVRVLPAGDFYKYAGTIPDLNGIPDSIPIDTDGDGINDSSLRRPPLGDEYDADGDGIPDSSKRPPFDEGEIDTDGDGIPDAEVAVPDDPDDDPVFVPDRATTVPGSRPPISVRDDDPVVPAVPGQGSGSSSRLIDQDLPGGGEPEAVASYAGDPLTGETVAYADAPDLAGRGVDDAGYGAPTYAAFDSGPDLDSDFDSYTETYPDSSTDSSTDLSVDV